MPPEKISVNQYPEEKYYHDQQKVTSEPKLSRRFCHTVVPPSTVTLKVASFHILKRIPGFSTLLLSKSKAKEVSEERSARGSQMVDMLVTFVVATACQSFLQISVVFPLQANVVFQDVWSATTFLVKR